MFGHIPQVPPGTWFEDRRALAGAGVHRPFQAGICGRAEEGAESIVLNGGYVDDEDLGSVIIYTGAGGNDPRTKRQTADQTLSRVNMALVTSLRAGLPVRVIRGSHPEVFDPPASGYRYDGLYRVADYWADVGDDGYRIWRFRLEALAVDTALMGRVSEQMDLYSAQPERREVVVSRIVRDTALTREVKRLYEFRCQVCSDVITSPTGPYAEAAHIRPLGRPHDGPDTLDNVLCLCPNHHVGFDLYAFSVSADLSLIGYDRKLVLHPRHPVSQEYIGYHRSQYEAVHA